MTTSDAAQAFLDGIGGPPLSFKQDGAGYIGTFLSMDTTEQTDPATGEVKTFDNGDPRMQLVVSLETALRNPADDQDDGERRWFVSWSAAKAFKAALRAARTDGALGDTIAVVHTGTDEPAKKGLNGTKRYAVKVWRAGTKIDPSEVVGDRTVADLLAVTTAAEEEPF